MQKVYGKVITVTRLTDYDFDIDVTWDMDRMDMRNTPTESREKILPFNRQDQEILYPLLASVVSTPYARHPYICEWLEYVIAQYFKGGACYAMVAMEGGPEAYKRRMELSYGA